MRTYSNTCIPLRSSKNRRIGTVFSMPVRRRKRTNVTKQSIPMNINAKYLPIGLHWTFPAEYRTSYRYKPAFSYMDDFKCFPGKHFVVTSTEEIKSANPDDIDGNHTLLHRVIAPRGMKRLDVERCLREQFRTGGCSHDYDCCGCRHSYCYPRYRGKRRWSVLEYVGYNV